MRVVFLFSILLSCLLCACTSRQIEISTPESKIIYLSPELIARPSPPKMELYDSRYGLDEPRNFKKFQRNMVLLTDYIENLNVLIDTYEKQIKAFEEHKKETN